MSIAVCGYGEGVAAAAGVAVTSDLLALDAAAMPGNARQDKAR